MTTERIGETATGPIRLTVSEQGDMDVQTIDIDLLPTRPGDHLLQVALGEITIDIGKEKETV